MRRVLVLTGLLLMMLAGSAMGSALSQSTPTPTPFRLAPPPTRMPIDIAPRFFMPQRPPVKVDESTHFTYGVQNNYLPINLTRFKYWTELQHQLVASKLGVELEQPVMITFQQPPDTNCRPRGAFNSRPDTSLITVYADETTTETQLKAVIAHEIAHAIQYYELESGLSAELALNEGLATWAATTSWLDWMDADSLESMVRGYIADGVYLPLYENIDIYNLARDETCLTLRNQLYTEWASFSGWLIERNGLDTFLELSASAHYVAGDEGQHYARADFEGIYGATLNQLEAQWLVDVRAETEDKVFYTT